MSKTELLPEKVVPSELQFEKDGFTFLDSTEHLMPKIEIALENKQTFTARHKKKYFLNRLCVHKENDFASSNSTFDLEDQKSFLKGI